MPPSSFSVAPEGKVRWICDSRSVTDRGGGCGASPPRVVNWTAAMTKNSAKKKAARAYQATHPGTSFPEALRAVRSSAPIADGAIARVAAQPAPSPG